MRVLHPSSKGKRVHFCGGRKTVIDGPFAETKELVAGYWIWQVKSIEDAVEWVRRCPDPTPSEESEVEIRPVLEAEDFGKEFTPELRRRKNGCVPRSGGSRSRAPQTSSEDKLSHLNRRRVTACHAALEGSV